MPKFLIVLFLLFNILTTTAQNLSVSFWKLSRPEKWWVVFHPFVACKAKEITNSARQISHEMKQDSLLDGNESGGQVDAFRHSFWMALLGQKMSERKAIALGKAHEKGDFLKYKKGKSDEESTIPDSISSVMDLFNNDIGAAIGKQNKNLNSDSLKKIIRTEILNGKMKIISVNDKGDFLDCNGNIIDTIQHKNTWNIPKCLIASNIKIYNK